MDAFYNRNTQNSVRTTHISGLLSEGYWHNLDLQSPTRKGVFQGFTTFRGWGCTTDHFQLSNYTQHFISAAVCYFVCDSRWLFRREVKRAASRWPKDQVRFSPPFELFRILSHCNHIKSSGTNCLQESFHKYTWSVNITAQTAWRPRTNLACHQAQTTSTVYCARRLFTHHPVMKCKQISISIHFNIYEDYVRVAMVMWLPVLLQTCVTQLFQWWTVHLLKYWTFTPLHFINSFRSDLLDPLPPFSSGDLIRF